MTATAEPRIAAAIEILRNQFSKHEKISMDNGDKLTKILNKADDELILALIPAKVRFVSLLAINHASRRGLI